jgi:imidazolonepropionase-like amidohydrolase
MVAVLYICSLRIDRVTGNSENAFQPVLTRRTPVFPGTGLHEELALPVKAGLMRAEALWAATVRPAEFLGRLDRAGSLTPGKDADLVLLDGDQLADITNTRRLSAVILKGKLR